MTGRTCDVVPLDPECHGGELFAAFAADGDGRMWTYMPYGPFADAGAYRAWAEQATASQDPLFFAVIARCSGRALGA